MVELLFFTDDVADQRLCRQYWDQDDQGRFRYSVAFLAESANLKELALVETVRQSCTASMLDRSCSVCQAPYSMRVRGDYARRPRKTRSWLCEDCQTKATASRNRANAHELRRKLLDDSNWLIGRVVPRVARVDDLTFEVAVGYRGLLRIGYANGYPVIWVAADTDRKLTPSPCWDAEVLWQLVDAGLLEVADDRAHSFSKQDVSQEWIRRVVWFSDAEAPDQDLQAWDIELESILRSPGRWPTAWLGRWRNLWHRLALEEATELLLAHFAKMNLAISKSDLGAMDLSQLLRSNSFFQLALAMDVVFAEALQPGWARLLVGNDLVQDCLRRLGEAVASVPQEARSEGYMEGYWPPNRTAISLVLHYEVLKHSDQGYSTVIPAIVE